MRTVLRLLCTIGMTIAGATSSAGEAYPEAAVKAAFLLRFAEYVEWPTPPQEDFVIAVLDRNEMVTRLREIATRPVHGRPVRVRQIRSLDDARGAHMLFVGSQRRRNLHPLLQSAGGQGLLVVTEEEHGLASGSIINLLLADGRVRFEVSLAAARRGALKVSSELLSVAARVTQ